MGYPEVLVVVVLGNSAWPVALGLMPPAAPVTSVPLLPHNITDAGYCPVTSVSGALPYSVPTLSTAATGSGFVNPVSTLPGPALTAGLGLSLSPATAPFPQRLVDKVRSGQFVEMRELLTDNVSLLQQLETFGGQHSVPTLPGLLKPRL